MLKKTILLPLAVLTCFSLSAWDWHDPAGSYTYGMYNYYLERPWLLPPSEHYWYAEAAKPAPVQNTYNTYNYEAISSGTQVYATSGAPPVVVPLASWAPEVLPGGVALPCDTDVTGDYRFQDLESLAARQGYLGLAWGTPLSLFQSRFRDAQEVNDANNASPRVRRFVRQSVDDGIQASQFLFLDDRLFEVYVLYGYVDDETTAEMQKRLARLYGQPVDILRRTDSFNSFRYDIADTYMVYNNDMQVVLSICDVFDSGNTFQGKVMTSLFSNPQIRIR